MQFINRPVILIFTLIAVGGLVAQDFTPSIFDRDPTNIPLNRDDPTLDPWSQLRDPANDPEREPGPFYPGRLRNSGVLTFFQLPIALNAADLQAGDVDVAILGAQVDMGVGMRGAGNGPNALRSSLGLLGGGDLPHMHVGVAWKQILRAVDYGNAPIDRFSVERSMPPVRQLVREIAETGTIPIVIGGDHSLEYPDVAGVADVYGKENVGVIHFDAHYDAAADGYSGHLMSHAQPVYRLIEEGHVLGSNYIQVGLRGYWPTEDGFNWMRENNFRYHTMVEIERDG
jgi:agmatinase